MINLKIHPTFDHQLCSVRGIDESYPGKRYLQKLFHKLFERTGHVLLFARRNNYNFPLLNKIINEEQILGIKNLKISNDLFEVSFCFYETASIFELQDILVDLWFAYEQISILFFVEKSELSEYWLKILNGNLSWNQITNMGTLFILFKGVEEDVAWIGKSRNLEFNFM